jgi:hypothetical protein
MTKKPEIYTIQISSDEIEVNKEDLALLLLEKLNSAIELRASLKDRKFTFADYRIHRPYIKDVEVRRLLRSKMKTGEVWLQANGLVRIDNVPVRPRNTHVRLNGITLEDSNG